MRASCQEIRLRGESVGVLAAAYIYFNFLLSGRNLYDDDVPTIINKALWERRAWTQKRRGLAVSERNEIE